jgi:rubredoxin
MHIGDNTGVGERKRFVFVKQGFPRREAVGGERVDVAAGVCFNPVKETNSCVVAGVGREEMQRLGEQIVRDNCLREASIVDTAEDRECGVV